MDATTIRELREMAGKPGLALADRLLTREFGESEEKGLLLAAMEGLAERAIETANYYQSHDIARRALQIAETLPAWPKFQIIRLQALALARSGAFSSARKLVMEVIDEAAAADPAAAADLCSLMARTFRDEASPLAYDVAVPVFAKGLAWASRGYALMPAAYQAGQVAQFARLAEGPHSLTAEHAIRLMRGSCLPDSLQLEAGSKNQFWSLVNLAEADLLDSEWDASLKGYKEVLRAGQRWPGDLGATMKVCKMLLPHLAVPSAVLGAFMQLFEDMPSVIVFSGHMIDLPDRPVPRFPAHLEMAVSAALQSEIRSFKGIEGFCCGAPGGDIIFGERLLSEGGKLSLLLPFDLRGTRDRTKSCCGEGWALRFDSLVERSTVREMSHALAEKDEEQCSAANRFMLGKARLRAEMLGMPLKVLLLWDEKDQENPLPGGTGDFSRLCQQQGLAPTIMPVPH